jgi:hypothetical protein
MDEKRDDRDEDPIQHIFDVLLLCADFQLDGIEQSLGEGEVFLEAKRGRKEQVRVRVSVRRGAETLRTSK